MFVNCIKIPSFAIKKTKIRVKVSGKDPKYQTQNSLTCKPDKNTTYHQSEIFDSEPFTTKTKTTARIDKKTKKLYSNYTKPNLNKNKKIVHKSILSSYNTNKNKLEFKESKLQINPGKTVSNFYRAQNSLEFTNTEPGFYKKFSKVDDKKFIRSGSLNPKSNNTQNYDIGREMALKRTNSTNIKKNNSTKKNVVINKGNKSKTTQKIVKIETINTTINFNEAKKIKYKPGNDSYDFSSLSRHDCKNISEENFYHLIKKVKNLNDKIAEMEKNFQIKELKYLFCIGEQQKKINELENNSNQSQSDDFSKESRNQNQCKNFKSTIINCKNPTPIKNSNSFYFKLKRRNQSSINRSKKQ